MLLPLKQTTFLTFKPHCMYVVPLCRENSFASVCSRRSSHVCAEASAGTVQQQSQEERLMRNRIGMSQCWRITTPLAIALPKTAQCFLFFSYPVLCLKPLLICFFFYFLWTFLCFWSPHETVRLRQGWSNLLHFFVLYSNHSFAHKLTVKNARCVIWCGNVNFLS